MRPDVKGSRRRGGLPSHLPFLKTEVERCPPSVRPIARRKNDTVASFGTSIGAAGGGRMPIEGRSITDYSRLSDGGWHSSDLREESLVYLAQAASCPAAPRAYWPTALAASW